MKGQAAAARMSKGIEDLTEDQMAEVERVLSMLRGFRRVEADSRENHVEGAGELPFMEKFCFAGVEEDI
ncbi:MAG TPA: hypothetical protein PLR60_03525 [Syntrophorhabdaceae bacterium]|nr:hypothetical protein [Syntrophorhabdaceae bacterium]